MCRLVQERGIIRLLREDRRQSFGVEAASRGFSKLPSSLGSFSARSGGKVFSSSLAISFSEGFMKDLLGPTGTEEMRAFQALQPGKTIIIPGDIKEKIRKDLDARGIQYNDTTILNAYLAMKDAK